jgi:hypothetical protein
LNDVQACSEKELQIMKQFARWGLKFRIKILKWQGKRKI